MNTTLVINPKGGSGKTTVSVNLASYFAAIANVPTAILDFDPQGSSLNWLRQRPAYAPPIHGANAARQARQLRSMAMYVPPETQQLIIDAPAGASGFVLQDMLARADCIVIPLPPSAIDIHATANFISGVLNTSAMQARNLPIAVVANKVRRTMPSYEPLEWFLDSFRLKLTARLVDSDVFVKAAEAGVGIFDMDPGFSIAERRQFTPIADWVENLRRPRGEPADSNLKVYELNRTRFA